MYEYYNVQVVPGDSVNIFTAMIIHTDSRITVHIYDGLDDQSWGGAEKLKVGYIADGHDQHLIPPELSRGPW